MMRLFFALQPQGPTALAIAEWRDRQLLCNGKAVPPANFHLTLAFLGELRQAKLEALCDAVDHGLLSINPATEQMEKNALEQPAKTENTLCLNTLGYWPRPGIFWLGPDTWPQRLERLASKLRSVTQSVGGRRDRKQFQPHVTLYRGIGDPPAQPLKPPKIDLVYYGFSLFESRLKKNGASYHSVCDWTL